MAEFVIEKHISGLGELSPLQRELTVRRSCSTLHGVAPNVAWVRSYLTDNKCYCVFEAPSEQTLRDLIDEWGLEQPISIMEVRSVIGPESDG